MPLLPKAEVIQDVSQVAGVLPAEKTWRELELSAEGAIIIFILALLPPLLPK